IAFDFFNISGSLFVNQETDMSIRSSAQGLFMMMTNGFGATIGTVMAHQIKKTGITCLSYPLYLRSSSIHSATLRCFITSAAASASWRASWACAPVMFSI
ncbi:MAG: hypothetical protein IKT31_10585, partial [Firmicutes bacterium]|nr:hypothetical protein [Bacillota bacterium]